jgi:hypothetical protein
VADALGAEKDGVEEVMVDCVAVAERLASTGQKKVTLSGRILWLTQGESESEVQREEAKEQKDELEDVRDLETFFLLALLEPEEGREVVGEGLE